MGWWCSGPKPLPSVVARRFRERQRAVSEMRQFDTSEATRSQRLKAAHELSVPRSVNVAKSRHLLRKYVPGFRPRYRPPSGISSYGYKIDEALTLKLGPINQ